MSGDARSLPWTRAVYDRPRDGRMDGKPERDERGRTASGGRTDTDVSSSTTTTTKTKTNGIFFVVFVDTIEMKTSIETEYEN